MCLATAYWNTENTTAILEEIAYIRVVGNMIELESLFGKTKAIQGKITKINFMDAKIILEKDLDK